MPFGVPLIMRATCAVLVLLWRGVSAAGEAAAVPLEGIASSGVDADLGLTLGQAQHALESGNAAADEKVLEIHLSTDRFTAAQRDLLAAPSAAVLARAGKLRLEAGELSLAVRDLDAAWELTGKRADPLYASALIQWLDAGGLRDPAEILYVARRARLADPSNPRAIVLDESVSNNPYRIWGWAAQGVALFGLAAAVVCGLLSSSAAAQLPGNVHTRAVDDGLIARARGLHVLSIATYGGAGGLELGGLALLWGGARNFHPTSPELLPALPEGSR